MQDLERTYHQTRHRLSKARKGFGVGEMMAASGCKQSTPHDELGDWVRRAGYLVRPVDGCGR
jgi:hypothetical protein